MIKETITKEGKYILESFYPNGQTKIKIIHPNKTGRGVVESIRYREDGTIEHKGSRIVTGY